MARADFACQQVYENVVCGQFRKKIKSKWCTHMAKLWRKTKDAEGKSKLEEIDQLSLELNKPTVIFLSGFFTTNKQPGHIAGAIKHLEEVLGDGADVSSQVDLYAWSHKSLANLFNLVSYNTRPHRASSGAANKLARNIILPLVATDIKTDEKTGRLTGTPRPEAEARTRLSNLTLFGYSAGTILAQETFNAARDMMREMGFEKKHARSLLNDVVLISTGNMSRPTKEKGRFTTLYLAATNDRLVKLKNRMWLSLKEMFISLSGKLTIRPLSDTSLLIAAPVKRNMWVMKKMRDGQEKLQKIQKLYPKWSPRASFHELPHYTTNDDTQNEFASIVTNALTNAIRRDSRLQVMDLLEPASPLLPTAANANAMMVNEQAYRQRIKNAVHKPSVQARRKP